MKFGKSYLETLESHALPSEWREGAIEYKHVRVRLASAPLTVQLKRLLKGVVDELELMGLNSDVLDELLSHEDDESRFQSLDDAPPKHLPPPHTTGGGAPAVASPSAPQQRATPSALLNVLDDSNQRAQPGKHDSPAAEWISTLPHDRPGRGKRRSLSDPAREERNVESFRSSPNTYALRSSNADDSTASEPHNISPRRRASMGEISPRRESIVDLESLPPLALPHDSPEMQGALSPGSMPAAKYDWRRARTPRGLQDSPTSGGAPQEGTEHVGGHWIKDKSGRRAYAEYQILGSPLHVHPRLVLHVQSPDTFSRMGSPQSGSPPSDTSPASSPASRQGSRRGSLLAMGGGAPNAAPRRRKPKELDLGPSSLDPEESRNAVAPRPGAAPPTPKPAAERLDAAPPGYHSREVVIPLPADERFFESLGSAVQKLVEVQKIQQRALVKHVQKVCDTIAHVASPLYTPTDMYEWREIFALWLEHEIFESTRERDRGELSVMETQARLRHFILELQKRGWLSPALSSGSEFQGNVESWVVQARSPNNPFRDPRSIAALEHFLRLNVALLELKRFQRVNIEAVRKILKKHSKQTALHARINVAQLLGEPGDRLANPRAADLPSVIGSEMQYGKALVSLANTLPNSMALLSVPSLPRSMAALMTKALLPVLPSVDDYGCAICMSIAWQPIRLDCKHLFCIRCLVKLQKQGMADCPLCREPGVVESADERNVDREMMEYLRTWFPNEVEEKTAENRADRSVEEAKERNLRRKQRRGRWLHPSRQRQGEGGADCIIM